VVEIRLSTPLPDLLDLLAQPELGLVWQGQGAGPMSLERQGDVAVLRPLAPESRGLPAQENWNERVRDLRVRVEPAASAVRRFDEGYADVVLGGTTDALPLVRSFGLSRGNLRLDPVIGLFGLMVVAPRGVLAEAEGREAVAMAIDREALLAEFRIGGWVPTTRIVSSEVADEGGPSGERWTDIPLAARQQTAAARVTRLTRGNEAEPLRIALPDSPGGTIIFERLRSDLGAIGLSLRRVPEGAPAELRLVDAAARYAAAAWFLNQLSCAAGRPVCSREADDLLAASRTEPDPLRRKLQVAQAEEAITAANGFIPFARPLRWSLVRGDVGGFAINPWGRHPLLPLALAPT
jgi:peptide/nickel transport system substrate-binding protein/oligopeptide transport system substrate-binding protein